MKIDAMKSDFKIAVTGGGMAAVCAAALFVKSGYKTLLVSDKKLKTADKRTTAILMPGIELLTKYAIKFNEIGTPLKSIYISDRSAKYFPQNDLCFKAREIELEMFGRNIANNEMLGAFIDILKNNQNAEVMENTRVKNIKLNKNFCELVLQNESDDESDSEIIKNADLVIAADGHNSLCREKAKIGFFACKSDYRALVFECSHKFNHEYRASEIIFSNATLTIIPLEGNRSSIIWIMKKNAKPDFEKLKSIIASLLGDVDLEIDANQEFGMSSKLAHRFYRNNLVLLGDAAHKSLPFAAQGFNLCLGDIDFILSRIGDTNISDLPELIYAYHSNRYPIALRTIAGAELLKNGFFSPIFFPVGFARNCFFKFFNESKLSRAFVMKAGLHNSYR